MSFEIRPVSASDLREIEPLIADYQRFYEVEDIDEARNREFFSRFVEGAADGWLLAARDGDEAFAFACFYRHKSSLSATDTVLMNDLYVRPDRRGGGVGRALIEAGLDLVRACGATCLEWSTAPDNERAQRLYDSTGASRTTWITYELEP